LRLLRQRGRRHDPALAQGRGRGLRYPIDPHRARRGLQDQGAVMAAGEGALATIRTRGRGPLRGAADPDAAVARRVGWRLAALTVGLIAALLLVLGVAVYATMQTVLLSSLQQTVLQRTHVFLQSHSGQHVGP